MEKLTVDGRAVTGVSIARAGERVHLKSRCETILSAGAYGSPEILIRELARTVYHPSGTCRMGIGNDCVVRPDLTVYGMERLRVADALVMPLLVSGNTNAPSIMIGERCADFIRSNRSPH